MVDVRIKIATNKDKVVAIRSFATTHVRIKIEG